MPTTQATAIDWSAACAALADPTAALVYGACIVAIIAAAFAGALLRAQDDIAEEDARLAADASSGTAKKEARQ